MRISSVIQWIIPYFPSSPFWSIAGVWVQSNPQTFLVGNNISDFINKFFRKVLVPANYKNRDESESGSQD